MLFVVRYKNFMGIHEGASPEEAFRAAAAEEGWTPEEVQQAQAPKTAPEPDPEESPWAPWDGKGEDW